MAVTGPGEPQHEPHAGTADAPAAGAPAVPAPVDPAAPVATAAVPDSPDASADRPATAWRGPSLGRWLLFAAIAIGVVVADQLSKSWLVANLEFGEKMSILGDWLNFVHWRNDGALFGLLPQSATAFALVSVGVIGLIVVFHQRSGRGIVTTIALALLLGGAIGNLIDRLRWASVVDWIDMGIGSWRFYTYNVADAAITVSIICLIALAVFPRVGEWGADG